jgi:hypothetical protein
MNKLTIFVKDAKQRDSILEKHPDIDAEFINMSHETDAHDVLPMVCSVKNGKERCEIGEEFIDILGGD